MIKTIKYIGLLGMVAVLLYSCTDTEEGLTNATLVNVDARLCPCCGGILIKLSENEKETYQWQQRGEKFGINPSDTFPIKVKIKYHFLANTCVASDGEIEITDLVKLK